MDTALFDYQKTFGTNLGMNKAQRLQTGESSMTHAMGEFPVYCALLCQSLTNILH